jgi:hypothetical protein
MAEAAAILGCISASGSIIVTITRTIKKLVELGKRFKEAGTTIKLLISQLSTIKSALQQIRDWADYTFADSPTQPQLAEDFRTAIDGCEAAMDALSEDVSNLVGNQTKPIGTGTRMKCVWNETTMKDHQDRLGHQIQALQLLVQASQRQVFGLCVVFEAIV